jgi:hypothetical protein
MGNTQYKTFEDNKHSVDDKIGLLERYLLSHSKKDFFESMVASSEIYKYMRYSDYLNNPQDYDKAALEKELVNYLLELDNCLKDEINFKQLATKAAEEQDKEKRKKLLMEMNRLYFNINFDFKAPMSTLAGPSKASPSKDVKEDSSKAKLNSTITKYQEEQMDPQQMIDEIVKFDAKAEYDIGKPLENFKTLVNRTKPALLKAVDLQKIFKKGMPYIEVVLKKLESDKDSFFLAKNLEETLVSVFKAGEDLKQGSGEVRKIEISNYYQYLSAEQLRNLAKTPELGSEPSFIETYLKSISFTETPIDISFLPDSPCKKALTVLNMQWAVMISSSFADLQKWLNTKIDLFGFNDLDRKFEDSLNRNSVVSDYVSQLRYCMPRKDGWLDHQSIFEKVVKLDFVAEHRAGTPQDKILAKYEPYFDSTTLKKKYAKIIVLSGGKVENLTSILSEYEMAEQRYEKILRLKENQCPKIRTLDEVKFTIEIKGISKLQLSVYEIDMENFYEKNPYSDSPDSINTRGFKPHFSIEKTYDHSQLLLFEEVIDLKSVIKKHGTFIVEGIGSGQYFKPVSLSAKLLCSVMSVLTNPLLR